MTDTKLCRTPLDVWSDRCRDLYLTTHSTLKRQKYPCPRWDSNPQSQQTSGLRAATGVGNSFHGVQNVTVSYTNILRFKMSAIFTPPAPKVSSGHSSANDVWCVVDHEILWRVKNWQHLHLTAASKTLFHFMRWVRKFRKIVVVFVQRYADFLQFLFCFVFNSLRYEDCYIIIN
jgi:hypothetical protein